MFIGAALIPLTVASVTKKKERNGIISSGHRASFTSSEWGINSLVRSPFDARYVFGIARFAGWLAIAALFIRGAQKKSQPT